MNLAHPIALAWTALAVPIIIFYILKVRLRREPVSTVLFWRHVFEEKPPRSIWQQLRHFVSLLFQLAFVALTVLALAEPFLRGELLAARRTVLVIDNSASMNATDVAPSRLARAKELARHYARALRHIDEMAVVAAGTRAQVVCGLTGQRRTLLAAIDSIEPSDGPTQVAEAVALARNMVAAHEHARILVVSDGCFEAASDLARAEDVEWITIGERAANVAITEFQVRRSLLDPVGYQILATVENLSDEPVECRLDVDLGEDVIDVLPIKLDAGGRWSQVLDKTSTAGGRLSARLSLVGADAPRANRLATDDTAWAILPQRKPQHVLLISKGNLFLEKVFEAQPLVALTVAPSIRPAIAPETIVVLDRTVPDKLPTESVWLIAPDAASELWQIGEPLDNAIVAEQDTDSPLLKHVRLDNVLMPAARRLAPAEGATVLVKAATNDPLYFAFERGAQKVLVLSVDLEQGDLPLRTAFPIMATNALVWFSSEPNELRESLAAGSIAEIDLAKSQALAEVPRAPSGTDRGAVAAAKPIGAVDAKARGEPPSLELVSPSGRSRHIAGHGAKATIGPLDACGVWTIARGSSAAGEVSQPLVEVACNLADRRESDLRVADELAGRAARLPVLSALGGRPIWFYLAFCAFALVTGEWFLYQRRWIS